MKKITAILIAMSVFLMTACSLDNGGTSAETTAKTIDMPPVQSNDITDESSADVTKAEVTDNTDIPDEELPKAQKFVDMINNRKVYFKCRIKDEYSSVVTETAYDGENMYSDQDFGDGVHVTMIVNSEGMFNLIHETKTYYSLASEFNSSTITQNFVLSTEEYDEYKASDGSVYRYFTDENGNLVSTDVIASDGTEATIQYMRFTDEIPEGIFEIPEGYTEEKAE